ncbi:hypothetical protein [Sediminicola luteus]|uniref:Uncharacterized protein n=1 Tax=Sediminicola luteus TaxID=319238 RepID=A0ABV2TST5_9FLAO
MIDKLGGKWLNVSGGRPFGQPFLIVFENGKIKYSFLNKNSKNLVLAETKQDKFNEDVSSFTKIEIINPNRIRLFRKGVRHILIHDVESRTEDVIFEEDYVRLLPTKSHLSESRIQLMKYDLNWKHEKVIIEFNTILDRTYIQEINKRLNQQGTTILLEKIDQTLLFSMLYNNFRTLIMPIINVDDEKMILCGFPEKPYEVIAMRTN